jgi:hypothetical protein
MRRWPAGTDQIPNGVWRDIAIRLDTMNGDLQYLVGEVKQQIGLVQVHSFKVWDNLRGDMVQPRAKSTAASIARIGGEIILGTAEWVSPTSLDQEGRVKEVNPGFQTQVFGSAENTLERDKG